jgi:signal transduction histidine kinase
MHDDATTLSARTWTANPALEFLTEPFRARTWAETLHLLLDFPIGVAGFVYVVTMLSLSGGLLITFVGVPLLAASVFAARWIAAAERGRAQLLLGERVPPPAPLRRPEGFLDVLKVALADSAGWRALLYLFVLFFTGTFAFCVVVTLWSAAFFLTTYPLWYHTALDGGGITINSDHPVHSAGGFALLVLAGLLFLFVTPWIVHGLATVDRILVRSLLGPGFLSDRVQALQVSRGHAVHTAAADLRRIERDLHDGTQARLVALAADLGMAKEKLAAGDDPEHAAALVATAHGEAKQALAELRDLARGIHPAVLTDRGLDAALSALTARSPVPVTVIADLPGRPAPAIEAIAYFCVSELLANAIRHSRASAISITITRLGGEFLLVEVRDDGIGGADPSRGTGLVGLAERIATVEGRFFVDSPPGGPTIMTVELPWSA